MADTEGLSWKKTHDAKHHIVSRSLGGPKVPKNTYLWTKKKHQAYHQLFCNFLPSMAIGIINLWTDENGCLKEYLMRERNVRAWQTVFPGATPAQAIKFIRRNFLPAEKLFLNGELVKQKKSPF